MFTANDEKWMQRALALAEIAAAKNEVPVGAVVVLHDEIIGEGYNQPISANDPTAHAEIIALRAAANHIGNYRLIDTTLYVTLEPCMMCAGAMVHARIKKLIFGAHDPRTGVVFSQGNALEQEFLNHKITHNHGLLQENCGEILRDFFKKKRAIL